MRKFFVYLAVALCLVVSPLAVQGYTINDLPHDSIGYPIYESYGFNLLNYTPGINNGNIGIQLFTNFPQGGNSVGSWNTQPADLFITETYHGLNYDWAIPLVSRTGFTAGTIYAVDDFNVSDDLAPNGGFIYNHDFPVQITAIGNNYGQTSFGGGTVAWNTLSGLPDFRIDISLPIYQDDPNGVFSFRWGTATCANDIVTGSSAVPEPATMLLLGSGLIGLAGWGRRKFKK